MIESHGGIKYATEKMELISKEAIDELNIFPDSDYKEALRTAVKFNLSRKAWAVKLILDDEKKFVKNSEKHSKNTRKNS